MRNALVLFSVLALSACVTTGPAGAPGAMHTYRGNLVVPDPRVPGQFEVFARAGDGGSDMWCAASEFAEDELRVPANRRIYLVEPRGPSRTRPGSVSAVFTVSPDPNLKAAAAALSPDLNMSVRQPGRNFLPIHGRMACRPLFELPFE